MTVLASQDIKALVASTPSLLEDFVDLDAQLQPNGFDMTVESIGSFQGPGRIGVSNEDRALPVTQDVAFGADGFVRLKPGPYLVTLREVVNLPHDIMAIAKPRSSLLRSGVAVHNAVWDAGYHGRSQALLVVYNPEGFSLARNARIIQMVFLRLAQGTVAPYAGRYQGEHLQPPPSQG